MSPPRWVILHRKFDRQMMMSRDWHNRLVGRSCSRRRKSRVENIAGHGCDKGEAIRKGRAEDTKIRAYRYEIVTFRDTI